ncbi:MAG: AAA family ATPase [Thaumarchaeota archaeon]|jgi:exonuclease SbcC|nr:AAA family ATPase [Candidatus Geocrenenecus arthurdayi]MCL7402958.1 AAA family ATPase [Candidatus Geocrenenecus arthurdayi]
MIEEVRLKNFEGYENAEVSFTEGLNLITGRNSAGKTSLLDSIVYGLFGTVPGIENKLLLSRRPTVRDAEVYLRFRSPKNDSRVEIYRRLEIKHGRVYSVNARLLVDGKEAQVESLEDLRRKVSSLLGVGYRSFNWIVYSKQGRILEILEPKKEEMDTVLGISLLQELSEQLDQARKKLSRINGVDVETEYRNLVMYIIPSDEERLREVEEDIQTISKEIEEIKRELTSIESPATPILFQKIRELEKQGSRLLEVKNTKRDFLSRYAIEKIDSIVNEEARVRDRLRKLIDEIHELEERLNEKIVENASISSKIKSLRQHLEQHQQLVKEGRGVCPTCGQTINILTLFEIISREEDEIANLEKLLHQSEEELSLLKKKLEEKKRDEGESRERRERLNALIETFRELEDREKNITRLVSILEAEVNSMLRSLNVSLDVKDPQLIEKISYLIPPPEMIQAKKNKLDELNSKLSNKIKTREDILKKLEMEKLRLNELEKRARAASIANALRDRIQEVLEKKRDSILKILASRALDILNSMTDQRFYHSIIIDPQTYCVNVHPIGLDEPIPATRIGGGHQTLISLALRLSVLYFINFRHLMILDEPTYGVDQENLQLLLNHLSSLGRYMKQTIIVTHHGYGLEEADNIITVYKDSSGVSRIKQEL